MTPQQLKNSILQQAIEGKLVEQRPEEGNGRDLLKAIQKEKAKLVQDKKIKKEKPLPAIKEEEIPFEIPDNWCWCRLGEVLDIARGGSPRPIKDYLTKSVNGINWIKIGDADKNSKYINRANEKIIPEGMVKSRYVKKGDFLLSNSMSYGRPYILNIDGCIHDGWLVLRQEYQIFDKEYLYYLLSSRFVFNQFSRVVAGAVVNNLNSDKVAITLVALPPLEEQKRIVARLAEILPQVEIYAQAYQELQELNSKFPAQLKNSLLQQAIEGKLVEQRPEEGNGRDLLKAIQKEKAQLVQDKKIKKEKALPEIKEEEIPFEIPDNWCWCRLGEVLDIARGGSPRPIKDYLTKSVNGINWIKIGDADKNSKYINRANEKIIPEGMVKSRYVKKGDFLLSNSMSYGRPYILNIDGCIHDGWLVLRQEHQIFDKEYLYYLLSSRFVFNQFSRVVAGAVVNNLNSDKVAATLVALPPLAEQKRIVAKLEQLLHLCQQLA